MTQEFDDAQRSTLSSLGVSILRTQHIPIARLTQSEFQEQIYGHEDVDEVLVQSLIADGQLQPILVWSVNYEPDDTCQYEIVSGHRRVAAARVIGWDAIRCEVAEWVGDAEIRRRIMVATNFQRGKKVAQMVAECIAIGAFGKIISSDGGALVLSSKSLTTREVAKTTGSSHATIARLCRIFDETYQLEQLVKIPEGAHEEVISRWEDIRYACLKESPGAGISESATAIDALIEWGVAWTPGNRDVKPKKEKSEMFVRNDSASVSKKPDMVRTTCRVYCSPAKLHIGLANGVLVEVDVDMLASAARKAVKKAGE